MRGHLPVAGSSAALPGDGKGKALLIEREWLALGAGGLRRVVTIGDALVPWSGGDYARRYQAAHCESGCGKIRCYPGRTCGDLECIAKLATFAEPARSLGTGKRPGPKMPPTCREAKASTAAMPAATSVFQRFGQEPGADVKVYSTGRDMRDTNAFSTPADKEAGAAEVQQLGLVDHLAGCLGRVAGPRASYEPVRWYACG
jgi:hypothetical protein